MTFSVKLHPDARRDRDRVVLWFGENHPEHIAPFLDDFYATARFVGENPMLRAQVRPNVRHESLRKYRYHLWFRVFEELELVEVFAVLHHSRDPRELDRRLT